MVSIYKKKRQRQFTLGAPIKARGIGLHSGEFINIEIFGAPADTGIIFQRTDISGAKPIPARYDHCFPLPFRTKIAEDSQSQNAVMTIEHLMAAFCGCGVDNAIIYVDGPEIPAFDGSARDYVFLLDCAGYKELSQARHTMHITRQFEIGDENAWVRFIPNRKDRLRLFLEIRFPGDVIGRQRDNIVLTPHNFRKKLINNRTFIEYEAISALHKQGLGKGGSLENTLVIKDGQLLNSHGLHSPKEFVRHKILDAIGDLFLSNCHLYGDFYGYCSGHRLNTQLVKELFNPPKHQK